MIRLLKSAGGWAACAAGAGLSLSAILVAPSLAQGEATETAAEPAPIRACVNGADRDTHVLNETTLLMMERGRSAVLVEVAGCRLNPHDPLVFKYRGTTQICDPIDVDMSVRSPGGFQIPCFAQSVTPISLEEGKRLSKQKFENSRK